MNNLMQIMTVALESKPKLGDACNQCGYCCLTEVCVIGQELGGGNCAPCKLLVQRDGKHFCSLAEVCSTDLGIGVGCCAETQYEVIKRLAKSKAEVMREIRYPIYEDGDFISRRNFE